ncbi:MAG: HNH endonuclease [Scytonematopsis contorta HA4267-MV1]|nr:HNH endonuclease [Scytonematopsis contorta HA4267-MV1]
MTISEQLRRQVIIEADYRCEYCKTSSRVTGQPPVIEHIFPRTLGGTDERENLAASCYRCNEFKGAKTHATDPETGQLVALFNPQSQIWTEHFAWVNGGTHVAGLTPTGRATVMALRLNNENIVESRAIWMEAGWHP